MEIKKVLPISDIHLETHSYILNISKSEVDIILLAGDIGNKFQAMPFIKKILEKGIKVVYILGNHEYYNINHKVKTIQEIKDGWKLRASEHNGFFFLDDDSVVIDGIKIIGSTFWSKIDFENITQSEKEYLELEQSDLKFIFKEKTLNSGYRIKSAKNINLDDYSDLHNKSAKYVEEELSKPFDGKTILLSHYPVLKESFINHKNNNILLNNFYVNDYEEMILKYQPDYIIHGHLHKSFDYMKNKTRNICNPLGYQKYNETNELFNNKLIIKIKMEQKA